MNWDRSRPRLRLGVEFIPNPSLVVHACGSAAG